MLIARVAISFDVCSERIDEGHRVANTGDVGHAAPGGGDAGETGCLLGAPVSAGGLERGLLSLNSLRKKVGLSNSAATLVLHGHVGRPAQLLLLPT